MIFVSNTQYVLLCCLFMQGGGDFVSEEEIHLLKLK
jgi:hypothetical protein